MYQIHHKLKDYRVHPLQTFKSMQEFQVIPYLWKVLRTYKQDKQVPKNFKMLCKMR